MAKCPKCSSDRVGESVRLDKKPLYYCRNVECQHVWSTDGTVYPQTAVLIVNG